MALKLRNALKVYERQDTAKINCGDDWFVEIKSLASCLKALSKAQAELRSKGDKTISKKQHALPSVSLIGGKNNTVVEEEDSYLLGSLEADVRFFVQNVMVGWTGLFDDDHNEVLFSEEAAIELFLQNGEPGKRLYRELLAASLDTTIFIQNMNDQVAEDAKN